jgi:hypothetical protein
VLADDLKKIQERERIAALDAGEARVAAELTIQPRAIELTPDVLARFDRFSKWCAVKQCRRLPAKPTTIAAYVLEQDALGHPAQQIISVLDAIALAHDHHSLPNPTQTAIVSAALDQVVKVEPPRSWRPEERAEWSRVPPGIRHAIARRESDRDKALRQAQNKLADERHALAAESALSERNIEHVSTAEV